MGGLPAWEGGHPGRHAGWKPALLKEERDALHSIVICSSRVERLAVEGKSLSCLTGPDCSIEERV